MLLDLRGRGPLYRRVRDAIRENIRTGRWPGGMRLPGTRTLARDLGVSRIVTVAAYEQLAAEGYLEAARGSGSRVVAQVADRVAPPPKPAQRPRRPPRVSAYAARARRLSPQFFPPRKPQDPAARIDFAYASTAPDAKTVEAWRRALARAATRLPLDYPDAAGLRELRELIARDLREQRGADAAPDDVIVVSGSQQALDITARVLCGEGTPIGIEDPHYQGTRQAFLAAGAKLVPCRVDDDGLDVGKHAARLTGARAVCVTPSHQFPTGAVMSVARRLKLLAWAARHGAFVVEDDYESEFRHGIGAVPALRGLDAGGRVIYIGTFGRSLFPGLRLGYAVVPEGLREHFRAVKWLADRGSSPTEQRALAEMLESGAYESARRRLGRSLVRRRDALVGALKEAFAADDADWSGAGAGTHVFLRLPRIPARATGAVVRAAARAGVRVYSALPYFLRAPREAALILGYATVREADIRPGISRLARVCGDLRHRAAAKG